MGFGADEGCGTGLDAGGLGVDAVDGGCIDGGRKRDIAAFAVGLLTDDEDGPACGVVERDGFGVQLWDVFCRCVGQKSCPQL